MSDEETKVGENTRLAPLEREVRRYDAGMIEITPEVQAIETLGVCTWTEDEDGCWFTTCGEAFFFDTDGPRQNKFGYCPYCGKNLLSA